MNIKLLDCTLRDGGFVNNWNFGYDKIVRIIDYLCKSNVDYVEFGFLDERETPTKERSMFGNMQITKEVLNKIDKKNTKLAAMIDYGTFNESMILDKKDTLIDCIRVMLKKEKMEETIKFCSFLKSKGYEVSVNAVAINRYNDEELAKLCDLCNIYDADTLTFTDTYGVLKENDVVHMFDLLDKLLNKNISIGFHSHNSLQLSFPNTMKVVSLAKNRGVVVDGSLYGMGKSAGNTCTELLVTSLNKDYNKNYNIRYLETIIEDIILEEYKKKYWGYSMPYYVAADARCHYNYVNFYRSKNISYSEIHKILEYVDIDNRFKYNEENALKALEDYNNRKKCIIFDIDGTLFNTENGIKNSIDYTVTKLGYRTLSTEEKEAFIGPSLFESFKNKYNLDDEKTKELVKTFRKYYQEKEVLNYSIYENMETLLKSLVTEGYILAVATNKREDLAYRILEDSSLLKYFTVVKGTDEFGSISKKQLITSIKEELNVKNDDVIMVGDTTSDYNAAKNSDVLFVGVTYGYGFKKDNKDNESLDLVDSVDELSKKLKWRSYES